MRISDWSSDVCSSDLQFGQVQRVGEQAGAADLGQARCSGVAIAIVEILPVEEGHQRRQRTALLPCPAGDLEARLPGRQRRSEEHTSELQSLMRISYAVFCLQKKKTNNQISQNQQSSICTRH